MSLTINAKTYNPHALERDVISYAGPNHTFSVKDLCTVKRQAPKPTATYRGNARETVKLTRTLTLDDSTKADALVNIEFSVPVGAANADVQALADDLGALLSSAVIDEIILKQDINH